MGYLRGSCFERLALLLICLLCSSYDCCFTKQYVSTERKNFAKNRGDFYHLLLVGKQPKPG